MAETDSDALEGVRIKKLFEDSESVAELHTTLTSDRGNYFRMKLLHILSTWVDEAELKQRSSEKTLQECARHINKLMRFKLVRLLKTHGKNRYIRTDLGERAVNATRALERGIGRRAAEKIYEVSLGPNSIKAFLKVYGRKGEIDLTPKEIKYTVSEIAKLFAFIKRGIDRISAMDKLDLAGLFVYKDDGFVYIEPRKAREFYRYLLELHKIIEDSTTK